MLGVAGHTGPDSWNYQRDAANRMTAATAGFDTIDTVYAVAGLFTIYFIVGTNAFTPQRPSTYRN